MKQLDRALSATENFLAAAALGLAAAISILNVVLRQFGQAWFWTEEAVIYLIIYSTFLGAVITLRHGEHVSVDIFAALSRGRVRRIVAVIAALVTIAYLLVMSWLGWLLLFEPFSSTTVTPVLKLPLWVPEAAVPIGMTLMLVRALEMLWRAWRGADPVDDVEEILAAEADASGLTREEVQASRDAISSVDERPVAEGEDRR